MRYKWGETQFGSIKDNMNLKNMIKKIVLLTGTELRHTFFRKFIAKHNFINVLASFCESTKLNFSEFSDQDEKTNDLRKLHFLSREITEKDFFQSSCDIIEDESNPIFIKGGDINN